MGPALATRPLRLEQFLAWERYEDLRYEFDGDRIIAMTGGTFRHHQIVGNVRDAFKAQLPAGCSVLTETFKLLFQRPDGTQGARYPDVMVTCRPIDDEATTTDSAVVVVEVLSPSSMRTDRLDKVGNYAAVPDVETYLVVDPNVVNLTLFRRRGSGLYSEPVGKELHLGHNLILTRGQIYAASSSA